jgi:phage replication O-like protein O
VADVQPENGYTKIAHELLERLALTKLSPTQYRIILAVWRYTYGFNRKEHEMSLTFISNAIGADKRNIQRELKGLEEMKIIHQEVKSGSYRKITFNKNYDEWIGKTTIGRTAIGEIANGESDNTTIGETNNGTIGETNNQERYKDNFKESSNSTEKQFSEIMSFYEKNLQKGISETPYNLDLINQWFGEFGFELLLAAMKVSAKAEAKGVSFTEGILKNWKVAGVKTIQDARKYEMDFRQHKQKRKNSYKSKDIDWEVL